MGCVRWVASSVSSPFLCLGLIAIAFACRAVSPVADAKLGPGVREALARDGAADVMIAIASDPASTSNTVVDRAEVARLQDAVLSALDSADFHVRQRYA